MAEQSKPGDVGAGANESALGEDGANAVQRAHGGHGFFHQLGRGQISFDAGGDDSGSQRLGQDEQIPGARGGVGHHAAGRDQSRDGKSENRLRIANGMPPHDRATGFGRFGEPAAQNIGNRFFREKILGHPHDVQRRQGTAAHGIDIGQRIGGGDLPVQKGIIHDGREKIDGLHQGAIAVNAINAGVIGGGGAHEQMGIARHFGEPSQNLRQSLLAELGRSTGAGGERRQFNDLFARHDETPPFQKRNRTEGRKNGGEGTNRTYPDP